MITIWLLWALTNGMPSDVRAYSSKEECMASWAMNDEMLRATRLDPSRDVSGFSLLECQAVIVPAPILGGRSTTK